MGRGSPGVTPSVTGRYPAGRQSAEPLVSIVMTVCDGDLYLAEAVSSIQAQSYRRWELIIVDNGSVDSSSAIVHGFAAHDSRIRVITVARGERATAANAGVAVAQGRLLARMDADDVALPERLEVQVRWMWETGLDLCGGWAMRFGDRAGLWRVPLTHDTITRELLVGFPLVNSSTIARTDVMKGNRYRENCACEDQELWMRLALTHRLGNVPALLVKYRCHPGQATRREATRLRADHRICRDRLYRTLFPDAPRSEAQALHRVAERAPCSSLVELDSAGAALARLAEGSDPGLRSEMLVRWLETCVRAADLGSGAERAYRQVAHTFDLPETDIDRWPALADGHRPTIHPPADGWLARGRRTLRRADARR